MTIIARTARACFASMFLVACVPGCARQPGQERYVPAPELARAAVAAVLEDWKAGGDSQHIGGLAVEILLTDTRRKKGQVLDDYEILGETPGVTARCFAVRVKLSQPDSEETIRYAVLGIDPLHVIRHEDLEAISHWEHEMSSDDPDKAPADAPPEEPRNEESNADAQQQ